MTELARKQHRSKTHGRAFRRGNAIAKALRSPNTLFRLRMVPSATIYSRKVKHSQWLSLVE